jgi:hypothetical protein
LAAATAAALAALTAAHVMEGTDGAMVAFLMFRNLTERVEVNKKVSYRISGQTNVK